MDENEVMTEVLETVEEGVEKTGIGTGWAMLIGGAITAAGITAGKALKKAWNNRKTKKAADSEVYEADVVDEESVEELNEKWNK